MYVYPKLHTYFYRSQIGQCSYMYKYMWYMYTHTLYVCIPCTCLVSSNVCMYVCMYVCHVFTCMYVSYVQVCTCNVMYTHILHVCCNKKKQFHLQITI